MLLLSMLRSLFHVFMVLLPNKDRNGHFKIAAKMACGPLLVEFPFEIL